MRPRTTRQRATLLAALLAVAALSGLARTAAAQSQVLDLPTTTIAPPPLTGDIDQVGRRAFWAAGKQRLFLASTVELGNFFVRAGAAAGYGKPHWAWLGVEASSASAPSGGVEYAGLRFVLPYADLRVGARYTFTASGHFLDRRPTYTHDQAELSTGPHLRYGMLEAEIAGGYPFGRGALFGIAGVYDVMGVPEGYNLLEQTLQIVAQPPLLWRARAGYLLQVDRWDMFRLGVSVEALGNPARGNITVRTGPMISALITHHFEAYGAALLVVHSPDTLGLMGAQLGELGFRYRWATGDRWPEMP